LRIKKVCKVAKVAKFKINETDIVGSLRHGKIKYTRKDEGNIWNVKLTNLMQAVRIGI